MYRVSVHGPSQPGTPGAKSALLSHTNLGNAINRVNSQFSPRRPRSTRAQQLSQTQSTPREPHRRAQAVAGQEIPTPLKVPNYGRPSKMAKSAKEAQVVEHWTTAASERDPDDNQATHNTTRSKKAQSNIHQRHPFLNIVNQPSFSDHHGYNSSAHINNNPKVAVPSDKQRLFPLNLSERKVQLPDVTGLTSALGSPRRALSEWQRYVTDGEVDYAEGESIYLI